MTQRDEFPKLVTIRQNKPFEEIEDVGGGIKSELNRIGLFAEGGTSSPTAIKGKRIGITAGSRGIHRIAEILRAIVSVVKEAGGEPIILPAMGSHGGGTEDGMVEVLSGIGVTEASVGAPIKACSESIIIGETDLGIPAYCNRLALEMDHLIVVNRIKKHTDFTGTIESGLHKMMTIGLGGPTGADSAHAKAMIHGYERVMVDVASVLLEKLPVRCGMAILENWKGHLSRMEAIPPEKLYEREVALLRDAKSMAISLPFTQADVLVVKELGKDISGSGMDGHIVGRTRLIGQKEPEVPDISRIVVLDLTPGTHGNAIGIGLADFITRRVYDAVDLEKTVLNCVTSMSPEHAAIPCTMNTDRDTIRAAIRTAGVVDETRVRLACIRNTKKLESFAVSESMLSDLKDDPSIEIISDPEPMRFDEDGRWINF